MLVKQMGELGLTGIEIPEQFVLGIAIHVNGPRRERPWVSINCGAVPESLLESELFGHRRGSFTGANEDHRGLFEAADGGTLFLDEIGETPAALQIKLLRVLQDGEIRPVGETTVRRVDVRIIAATNRDLAAEVSAGRFRQDLFYRLNVVGIQVPPLRDRDNDVLLLAEEFTRRFAKQYGKKVVGLSPDAVRWLLTQRWDGNIRELGNCIERSVTLCENGGRIEAGLLPAPLSRAPRIAALPAGGALRETLDAVEREEVRRSLEAAGGRVAIAAQRLGVSRQHLHTLIRKHGLRPRGPTVISD